MSIHNMTPQELYEAVRCTGCGKQPHEIDEYVVYSQEERVTPLEFVLDQEGTLNPDNGHFLCTDCYIKAGMPAYHISEGRRWVAP